MLEIQNMIYSFIEIHMENQVNASDQNTQQIGQNPVSQRVITPEKPKTNYLMICGIVLACFVVFGFGGYYLGKQKTNTNNVVRNTAYPIQSPTSLVQPSPTNTPIVDTSTKLLEPNLASTANWRVVTFPQNIIVSQGGESKPGKIEMKIPSNWTTKTIQTRNGKGIGGAVCNDFQIISDDGNTSLVIKPSCSDSNNDYLLISGQVQKVELTTKVGNDGHDSYTVRYLDLSKKVYHYGSIDVSPGASIDIQKDKIYPNLILQYLPDRGEQWMWTTEDLTYNGTTGNQQVALNTVDTIISTLKLTD
ncbi:MAG: hypothetical protein Q7S61_04195 [bacterium]|nr:hypothetical protein [bacterium]